MENHGVITGARHVEEAFWFMENADAYCRMVLLAGLHKAPLNQVGEQGVKEFILDTVKWAGSNPCPPIVVGVGIGGSFDKCAALAKKALLRPLDVPNPDPYYAALEAELLAAVNEIGIGPQGFGGRTTCLGLAIEQMPTHVAGLPAAVNVSCHVTRRATAEL